MRERNLILGGKGVELDYAESTAWFRRAADQGNPEAQAFLGLAYKGGRGVSRDPVEGLKWLNKAAAQGHEAAQFTLGIMYSKGDDVGLDYATAYMWTSLAAARGHALPRQLLDMLETKLTPEQIAGAQKAAREWKPTIPSKQKDDEPTDK
jgi:uncharacterized protein